MELWHRIDPKLKYTILSGIVTYLIAKYAIDLDADAAAGITGAIATAVGYQTPNDGTILRTDQEDGNAEPPDEDDE